MPNGGVFDWEREYCDAEFQLEEQLQSMLSAGPTGDRPHASAVQGDTSAIDALVTELETFRGRQQRAGWGQSSSAWDLPFIGSWDVIYSKGPSLTSSQGGDREQLVSARQWVYGPGEGGIGIECVFALPAGPPSGSLLLARQGSVTKLEADGLRINLDAPTQAFALGYERVRSSRVQQADGGWADVETVEASPQAVVGRYSSAQGPTLSSASRGLCAPVVGLARTTYLSDTIWVLRSAAPGAAAASSGDGGTATAWVNVLRRVEAEALVPQNGGPDSPDGFDARRFGPSGRRLWMMDTALDDKDLNYERARQRMRSADEISRS